MVIFYLIIIIKRTYDNDDEGSLLTRFSVVMVSSTISSLRLEPAVAADVDPPPPFPPSAVKE